MSEACFADRAVAEFLAQHVDQHDGGDDDEQDGPGIREVKQLHRSEEVVADASGTHEADDGGAAHVQLQAPERVRHIVRDDLRQNREAHLLQPVAAGRTHAVDRQHADVLVDLGEELALRAYGVHGDRQNARERADAECNDEKQRPYDVGHGARDLQYPARDPVGRVVAHQVTRAEEAQEAADQGAEHSGEIGHEQGIEQAVHPLADVPVPFLHVCRECLQRDRRH
jgi:hypothetical protein